MNRSDIEKGATRRSRAQGAKHEALHAALGSLDPRLTEWADGFIFGHVWDEELDFRDRMIVAIVALAATNKPQQLKGYLHGALQDGVDPRHIHEALVMLVVYCGFPTALQALVVWQEVVTSARKRGMDIDVPVQ